MSENCMGELVSVILLVVCVQVCVLSSRQHACMHMYVHVHSLCMQEDNTHLESVKHTVYQQRRMVPAVAGDVSLLICTCICTSVCKLVPLPCSYHDSNQAAAGIYSCMYINVGESNPNWRIDVQ